MNLSDAELLHLARRSDDRRAFGELVLRHQSAVRRFLRTMTRGDAAQADDLAQETFVLAHRTLAQFRGESSVLTWLLGLAHNLARNAARKARRREGTPSAEVDVTPDETAKTDLKHDLELALRALSDDERLLVDLAYAQGLSHGEIATVSQRPLGTIKTHLARAKDKLRPLLAAWNPHT